MYCLVHDLRLDKHIVQIDLERLSETCHPHNYPVRLGVHLVPHIDKLDFGLPLAEEIGPCAEEWSPEAIMGCRIHCVSAFDFPTARPPFELICNVENPSVIGTYYQRTVTFVHRDGVSNCVSDTL
jgi:hypothetical protein